MVELEETKKTLLEQYKEYTGRDSANLLVRFNQRFNLACDIDRYISISAPTNYLSAHLSTLKLSELWYCYELFKQPINEYGFGHTRKKSRELENIKWLISQRTSGLGDIEPENKEVRYMLNNLDFSFNPMGYANLFNNSFIYTKWYEYNLVDINEKFNITSMQTITGSNIDMTNQAILYLDTLSSSAAGEQRKFLADGFNRLMKNSSISWFEEYRSSDIMAFVYAVRCNYVHSGEVPDSHGLNIDYKEYLMKGCADYLTCYCCLIYMAIIDELYPL